MNLQADLFENHVHTQLSQMLGPDFQVVLTANRRIVVSVDRRSAPAKARVSKIFCAACRETIIQLGRFISKGGGGPLPPIVKRFIHEQAPRMAPPGRKGPRLSPKGKAHRLDEISERIAQRYFGGMTKVRITWGREKARASKGARRRSIRFGTYDKDLDLVTIHPALDDPRIPPFFVEYVVYHEMLHKVIPPISGPDGRTRFHTSQFKAREREFADYRAAKEWERESFWRLASPKESLRPLAARIGRLLLGGGNV